VTDVVELSTETAGDGAVVVGVAGDVTFANAAQLARELHAALDGGATRVVVDLTGVGFMDSSALAALLRAAATARASDASLVVVHDPAQPPNILRFKGVEQLVRMFPSRDAALAPPGGAAA
jgi:anti-sigma B factor antagonist